MAEVETTFGPVEVVNVHLRPPLSDEERVSIGAYLDSGNVHLAEIE